MTLYDQIRAALHKYGEHDMECGMVVGKIVCTCGFDDALAGVPPDTTQLYYALDQFGRHDDPRCKSRVCCFCGFADARQQIDVTKYEKEREELLEHQNWLNACSLSLPAAAPTAALKNNIVKVKVEHTLLLPRPTALPAVRVVGLPSFWPHFWRGAFYGAVAAIAHGLMHALGIW